MKRLLIAGGTGLAGSGVLRQVLAAIPELEVRVPHRGQEGFFSDDPRVQYVHADLADARGAAAAAEGCDAAVLAAATTGGAQQTRERPGAQVTENLVLDARLLDTLHTAGVRRLVFVSTASVYADSTGPIREADLDWNADPAGPYFGVGWAKRAAEKLCAFWHRASGTEIVIARLANVYGPYARFDPASSHFVAALVRKALAREDPFVVWGRADVVRDIVYADDFGRAVVRMLQAADVRFDVFNVGSGAAITVGEVAALALRHAGHAPARIVYDAASPTTIARRVLDCAKARDVLGWSPAVAPDEGIRRTMQWWRDNNHAWKR